MDCRTTGNIRSLMIASLVGMLLPAPGVSAAEPGDSRLADAVMKRDGAAVRALLGQKVDANVPGKDGTPALHWSVREDDLATARLLLGAGADATLANRYGITPLFLACANGNEAMIRLLLDAGADPNSSDPTGETALMAAVRLGSSGPVKLLLDRGAMVEAKDPAFQQTALMVAVRENHPEIVKLLLAHGAQPNATTRVGGTPAWILPNSVPGFGHGVGIVRGGLPARGLRNPIPGGLSPLLYAARDGRLDIARTLVEAGAEINQADANGISPLIAAITNNHVAVALFLIDRGADIHASDWYGRTPLWSAVETRNQDFDAGTQENSIDRAPFVELIKVLIERGANVDVRTKEIPPFKRHFLKGTGSLSWVDFTGQTPFLTAALAGDVTVMRLLLAHGADPHIHDGGGDHGPDGRRGHQLGLLPDLRRGTREACSKRWSSATRSGWT